ncbi:glycosyltransferase family 4 protein [Candidatus Woesearchaeota archaeon]|nr:glycosyltransferase family 4 protein [Candidatus Woesearchaeota archaeon]
MRVTFFGTWDESPRTKIMISGLRMQGVEVIECRAIAPWTKQRIKQDISPLTVFFGFLKTQWKLKRQFLKKYRKSQAIIVGYPGWFDLPLAKIFSLLTGRPLVFDWFLSLYEAMVIDRKVYAKNSFKGRATFFLDKIACFLADYIVLDTEAHKEYLSKKFKVKKPIIISHIGADEAVFHPLKKERKQFIVAFHGSFIPLQGIEFIIQAAKILEKEGILFKIIGAGQLYREAQGQAKSLQLKNVKFTGWRDADKVPEELKDADIGLGIFGATIKAQLVIPNKAYEVLAMQLPLITGKNLAIQKMPQFRHLENVYLCKMADASSLAQAILHLKKDLKLRKRLAQNGYRLFKEHFSAEKIGFALKESLAKMR